MKFEEVMLELESFGDPQTKKTLGKHGAKEPFFGVKVGDLKKIVKKIKKNHELSLELFQTGNSDAMYLAGLIADEKKITEDQLQNWVENAYWSYLNEYAVPWVAAETPFGFKLGLKWIDSDVETIASAGLSTLSSFASVNKDSELDIKKYIELLESIPEKIKTAKNREKYTMNGFVIAIGSFIQELTTKSMEIADKIGEIEVILEGKGCKVPLAKTYIQKIIDTGRVGNKKKTARC